MSLFHASRSRGVVVLAAAAVLAVSAGSGAVAGALITGKDIKNRTIEAQDLKRGAVTTTKVKNRTLKLKDLNSEVTDKLGTGGAKGATGPQGPAGAKGADGTASYAGPNWGIVDRNVIGNGDSYLRSGPFAGTAVKPPMGVGSLGLRTGSSTDKAAFGNQVDFAGKTLASITSVSFWEFTTGENRAIAPDNLASVAMEVNPSISDGSGAIGFTTLNFVALPIPANAWTKIDASTAKQWYFTGRAGTASNCNQVTYCTLAEVKAAAPAATLFTVQVGKGRDNAFSGAIDALQIGATTYDFEPFGVIETTS